MPFDRESDRHEENAVFSPGDLLHNQYRVEEIPGENPGRVLICMDTASGVRCALRALPRATGDSPSMRAKSYEEILLWIGLGNHPNIVYASGVLKIGDRGFVVMEAVEGGSLAKRLAQGALGWKTAARCGWQVANGLDYVAQVCGLVHRNLKPAKVLFTQDGSAKIADFNLIQTGEDAEPMALEALAYRAPELWLHPAENDVRSDIYSFGVLLFQMTTGRLPFEAATAEECRRLHLEQTPPDPRASDAQLPEPMASLILRCLEKHPSDRPRDFRTVRRVLEPYAGPQEKMPSSTPIRLRGLINQTDAYLELDCVEEAESAARNAIQLDAKSVKARVVLAEVLAARRAYPQALGHLEEAYRLSPAEPAPIVNGALYANRAGSHPRALRWLAIALETLAPRQLGSLIPMLIELGRIEQAIEICEKIVAENPEDVCAWNNLSIAWRRLEKLDRALECADRAVQINPRYARGWSNRATILVQQNKAEEALAAADRALELEPKTAGAYAAKAAALGCLGRANEGRQCLLGGLKLMGSNALLERALEGFK